MASGAVVSPGGGTGSSGSVSPKPLLSRPPLNCAQLLQKIEAAQTQLLEKKKRPFGGTTLMSCSKQKKTKTSKNLPVMVDWHSKLSALPQNLQWVVGIDMSLTNPGLCLLQPQIHLIHLFAFRNRVKEKNGQALVTCPESIFYGWLLRTTVIEEWPEPEKTFPFTLPRLSRYETRIQSLMGLIGENSSDRASMVVGLEHYAFAAGPTRGDSTLKELGGILRRQLCHMGHKVIEIVPSQVKRIFCQKGDAKKKDMYRAYRELYKLPDLLTLLNLRSDDVVPIPTKKKPVKSRPTKQPKLVKDPSKADEVPHPVEDMVDALAVALSVVAKM